MREIWGYQICWGVTNELVLQNQGASLEKAAGMERETFSQTGREIRIKLWHSPFLLMAWNVSFYQTDSVGTLQ